MEKDNEYYLTCALGRAKADGINISNPIAVIVYLEQEIEIYSEKIRLLTVERTNNGELTIENISPKLDLISPIGEFIEALSKSGYNNISINAYKTESEGE